MATNLIPMSVAAPGFMGLNTQEASVDLPITWSTEAVNCVIDKYGRVASRKGWQALTSSPLGGTPTIKTIFEYIKKDATTEIISCANNKIYKGTTTLTDLSAPGTITADNWSITNFNNKAYFFQSEHVPLEYDGTTIGYATRGFTAWAATTAYTLNAIRRPTTANPYYYVCSTTGTSGGAEPTWSTTVGGTTTDGTVVWTTYEIPKGDTVSGALGRLWVSGVSTDKTIVYYSDTLIGHSFTGGSSGTLDLKSVWTNGMDEVTHITVFNGMLVIFGNKSIILYSGSYNPASMALVEQIKGIGCIARDSVQDVGNDILFLSAKGLMSLSRAKNEDNIPMNDVSANVRDELLNFVAAETATNIRSVYNEREGFYLLNLPSLSYIYCFDVRAKLEDNTYRVTTWDSIAPWGLCSTRDRQLLLGKSGVVAKYNGYLDNTSTYTIKYKSTWLDGTHKAQVVIPKSLEVTTIGGFNSSLILSMEFDYSIRDYVYTKQLPSGGIAEYGVAEYSIAEYVGSGYIGRYKYDLLGDGRVFNFAITSTINGSAISIQKIDILCKVGRII